MITSGILADTIPITVDLHDGSTVLARSVESTLLDMEGREKAQRHKVRPGEFDLLAGLRIIADQENFDVVSLLGAGGMGAVAKARDRSLNRDVALKFVVNQSDVAFVRALKAEAEKTSQIAHENVVRVYSFHTVGEISFVAMEFIAGEDLGRRLDRQPPLKLREILRIVIDAARGIRAAHQRGIIHRDIKPQNILLGSDGTVKVADLGLAATREESTLNAALSGGTIGYMAPEQARGEQVAPAGDIFSLTATLYVALTGRQLLAKSPTMLEANRRGEFRIDTTGLDPALARFLARGLAREPNRRHLDMDEFLRELEALFFRVHQSGDAGWWGRLPRGVRNGVAATALLAAGLAAGAGAVTAYHAENSVARADVSAAFSEVVAAERAFLQDALRAAPQNASLVILRNDLETALSAGDPTRIAAAVRQARAYRER